VDEISEGAGFSRGAFYSNFADKEAIFLDLLNRRLERGLENFKAAIAQSPTLERLADSIAASYHDLGANPD
jgi:AcrR family transcriptional regulator